ncbi:MAG: neutral/alkaline non-lysosomal ceramidase N-terminal domain-containing protein [Pirellulaceae bacterium]|nr:neutral/alkaline non-lysosomal ceramidase N-terminal domain-containing protein [Pirellulaceae bacterium]
MSKQLLIYLASGLVIFAFGCELLAADEPKFLAGAGQADVTPTEPVPMWGYGSRKDALSVGTLDPLMATAIVIQAGEDKLAIVGLDLGRSPNELSMQRIRERIKAVGIDYSMMAGSHTHHGPVLELADSPGRGQGKFNASLRYYQRLEDGIVAAILDANKNLVPAKLATGSVDLEGFNRNRHSKMQPPPLDRSLAVMQLVGKDSDKVIATLVNFAAHPTSLPDSQNEFSSDYVGALRTEIESSLGGQAVFMQGASGDLSTNRGPHGDHAQYGRALGKEAVKLARTLKPQEVPNPSLKVREDRFTFKPRTDLNNPLIRAAYTMAFFPELVACFVDEYAEGVRPRITVALLNGQIALVGGSGEFFCAHAINLRKRARVDQLFFFGYCNGYHQYYPTIEGAAEGGYGADSQVAPAAVGAGEQLMNTSLEWIFRMQGAKM